MTKNWLIYGMGGGWGHINRSLALGRIASRDRNIQILTNSPYLKYLPETNCQIIAIDAKCDREETCQQVRQILLQKNYEILIVDTFPRGLGGELAEIFPLLPNIPKILIHRDLNPNYIKAKNLIKFVAHTYDRIIIPGEGTQLPFAHLPQTYHTKPWLIRNAEELPYLKTAYQLLKLDRINPSEKIILIIASGRVEELSLYGQLTHAIIETFPNIQVRCLSPVKPPQCPPQAWILHYPAIECLLAADIAIGSGGYNTVYECQALKIPLIAFSFPRMYDRQQIRLQKNPIIAIDSIENAIAAINTLLHFPTPKPPIKYDNGAIDAIKLINE
jgi:predicted glycosyltransferase